MKKRTPNTLAIKVRRGDTVKVLRGRDRGKEGKIMAVIFKERRVIVEGLNMVSQHVKPRRSNEKGQRVRIAAPLQVSNVQVICPQCRKATRITIRRNEDGSRDRVCKKCQAVITA